MTALVLDCSVALAWFLPAESTSATAALLNQVAVEGACAPTVWPLEVGNALLIASRRKRISGPQRSLALSALSALPIRIDAETALHAWHRTLELAEEHALTLYDATYLELAQRLGLPLASLDKDLRLAGQRTGVALLGV